MIKTFTALLEFHLGPSYIALMKANKPETNLTFVGNLYILQITQLYHEAV